MLRTRGAAPWELQGELCGENGQSPQQEAKTWHQRALQHRTLGHSRRWWLSRRTPLSHWEVLCWGPSPEAPSQAVIELLHHNKIP